MDYNVAIYVEGFYSWHGKAPNKEIAEDLAVEAACKANFGELKDIEIDVHSVEEDK